MTAFQTKYNAYDNIVVFINIFKDVNLHQQQLGKNLKRFTSAATTNKIQKDVNPHQWSQIC